MIPIWLLFTFIICAGLSLVLSWIAKFLFPRFRSGEFQPGPDRPDVQTDVRPNAKAPEIKSPD